MAARLLFAAVAETELLCPPWHRCAHSQDDKGRWNKFGGRLSWDQNAICNNNPAWGGRGNHKTGDDYPAAPNLDHTQEWLRNDIVQWLQYLRKSIGFDGWRFDFVRGYGGQYVKTYTDATVGVPEGSERMEKGHSFGQSCTAGLY